ncbi:sugar/nucleoside kinase (ribokinase family) [Bifidobacterium commune]|uniref:PfkB family carbohydrate kinase n=1 Tax=Bifidobacterium commune TaxID=1505727 RepID=UPI00181AA89C|nr:hypothetical protein [Bifidobacterium commune]MBB2955254.1 sugar/nucleoside kinase (ribokinase family) [Bifidobacterium commune]
MHDVSLIGNVGSDSDSDYFFAALHHWNIDTSGAHRVTGANTGKAYMFITPQWRLDGFGHCRGQRIADEG